MSLVDMKLPGPKAMSEALEVSAKAPAKALSFLGTSYQAVERALRQTFGAWPIQLNKFEHEQVLKGMVAAAGDGAAPYKQLLESLRAYDEIEVRQVE